jgi:hypothetical protein
MKCQRITLMTTRRQHRSDNGKSHCKRGFGGIPYSSSSDLDQGTFSMAVGCSVVKGRVEVRKLQESHLPMIDCEKLSCKISL